MFVQNAIDQKIFYMLTISKTSTMFVAQCPPLTPGQKERDKDRQ